MTLCKQMTISAEKTDFNWNDKEREDRREDHEELIYWMFEVCTKVL